MLFLLLLISPIITDSSVNMAEVNTYGGKGCCQIILWDWSFEHHCFVVVDWKSVNTDEQVSYLLGKVKYGQFRETWTRNDPEVDNRSIVPTHKRRKIKW